MIKCFALEITHCSSWQKKKNSSSWRKVLTQNYFQQRKVAFLKRTITLQKQFSGCFILTSTTFREIQIKCFSRIVTVIDQQKFTQIGEYRCPLISAGNSVQDCPIPHPLPPHPEDTKILRCSPYVKWLSTLSPPHPQIQRAECHQRQFLEIGGIVLKDEEPLSVMIPRGWEGTVRG